MISEHQEAMKNAMTEFKADIHSDLLQLKMLINQANMVDDELDELKEIVSEQKKSQDTEIKSIKEEFSTMKEQIESQQYQALQHDISSLKNFAEQIQINQIGESQSNKKRITHIKKQLHKLNHQFEGFQQTDIDEIEDEPNPDLISLQLRVDKIDENLSNEKDKLLFLENQFKTSSSKSEKSIQFLSQYIESFKASLPPSYIEQEEFNGLKNEVSKMHSITTELMEQSISKGRSSEKKIRKIQSEIKNIKTILENANIGISDFPDTQEIGSLGTDKPPQQINDEIERINLLVSGNDLAIQKQLRKMKKNIRALQKEISESQLISGSPPTPETNSKNQDDESHKILEENMLFMNTHTKSDMKLFYFLMGGLLFYFFVSNLFF